MAEVQPLAQALAHRLVIILVQPQHSGNVGAAARAMKNMGLRRLVLVDPPCYDPEQARWMAPGCDDMLAGVQITATLDEALEGVHRVVATTARHRKQGHPVYTPREIAAQMFERDDPEHVTAILFGREDFGLPKDAVLSSESLCRIPTPEHASLNLGQAVLLTCHAAFEEARARGLVASGRTLGGSRSQRTTRVAQRSSPRDRLAAVDHIDPAVDELVELLERVGYTRGTAPDKVRLTGRQALQRGALSVRHVEALRGMVRRIEWALDHPDLDWKATKGSPRNS